VLIQQLKDLEGYHALERTDLRRCRRSWIMR
jgi:hypothetical protein